jgi:hypothetical protein
VTTYSRNVTCTKGHRIALSFAWDPDVAEGPKEYSEPCPVSGCDGRVTGKLPIGADYRTLKLTGPQ